MIIIGEKLNSSIPSVHEAIEKRNADFVQDLARRQEEAGAHYLDINAGMFVEQECENLTQKMFYVKTGNSAVDSIINTKQKIAEEKGIIFSSNISLPAEYAVSDMDMVCVLGNLIDNAIEACEKQTSKYIEVDISEVKKMILIKIVNSYNGEKNDTSVTSKKEKTMHGIGIKNVKKIVAKYKGAYDMECEDDEVVTTVTMLYK